MISSIPALRRAIAFVAFVSDFVDDVGADVTIILRVDDGGVVAWWAFPYSTGFQGPALNKLHIKCWWADAGSNIDYASVSGEIIHTIHAFGKYG
jgi:hypothetical protein